MKYIVKDFNISNDTTKIIDIEQLKNARFSIIQFDYSINYGYSDGLESIITCDYEHPFALTTLFSPSLILSINKKYYLENIETIQIALVEAISKLENELYINDPEILSNEIIEAICDNENIKMIAIGNKKSPFYLNKELYEKLKKSGKEGIYTEGVEDGLIDVFDPIIKYNWDKKLIGYLTYGDLIDCKNIIIYDSIKDSELKYYKYLPENTIIFFNDNSNYEQIFNDIKKIRAMGVNNLIRINAFENKNLLNDCLLANPENIEIANIEIENLFDEITLKEYFEYEKTLLNMVEEAKGLSPFEQYLYVYNIVKKYKEYNECYDDLYAARKLYDIIKPDNEYMVCVGYSTLLGDLLDKLGIENCEYRVSVATGFSYSNLDETKDNAEFKYYKSGHNRREVHIIDDKYGIDGYFLADPTWDNDMQEDYYNYALLTHEEYLNNKADTYISFTDAKECFFVNSVEEFYQKANIWMDKNWQKLNDEDKKNSYSQMYIEVKFIIAILKELKFLDKNKYNEVSQKYPQFFDEYAIKRLIKNKEIILDDIINCITELAYYIVSKVNNPVDEKTFYSAVSYLYENVYHVNSLELDELLNKIITINSERSIKEFPERKIITNNEDSIKKQ